MIRKTTFNSIFVSYLFVTTALVAIPLLLNRHLLFRSDSYLHANLATYMELGIPPQENPFLSSYPLIYYYFYDIIVYLLSKLFNDIFFSMAFLNIISLICLILIFNKLISKINEDKIARHFSNMFLIHGMNSLGALFILLNFLNGQKFDTSNVSGILGSLSFQFDARLGTFICKYLVGNSLPMGIFLLVLSLFFIIRIISQEKFDIKNVVIISIILVILGFTQAILTFTIGCSIFIYIIIQFSKKLFNGKFKKIQKIPLLSLFISALIGLVIPYFHYSSIRDTQVPISFFTEKYNLSIHLNNLFIVELVVIILALIGIWTLKNNIENRILFIIIFAITSSILSFTVLPDGNQYKFIYVVHIPLSILAGFGISRIHYWKHSRLLIVCLIIFMTVNSIFVSYNYLNIIGPQEFKVEEIELGDFIKTNTPISATFLEQNIGSAIIPILGIRKDYLYYPNIMIAWGYPKEDIQKRRSLTELVFSEHVNNTTEIYSELKKENINYVLIKSNLHNNLFDNENMRLIFKNSKYKLYEIT